ncbi:MAG: serine/threonine protein kinase, partial [Planctomycetes bacterium]|nr:serine/threonine protein kinase [Planctomycetota bacterium]
LLLEYVSGGSLRDQLEEEPISWEKACRYGIQISRALDYLHRNGAIHRDVKPHNILLHPERGAVLADLGLVLREEDPTLTRQGAALGSPAYMSPEQSRNPSAVDVQTDIYSLGATLYHAISGRPPFVGKGVGEVIHRVLHESPPDFECEIPQSLENVIFMSMSREEDDRYDRARSMGADLGRIVLGYRPHLRSLRHGKIIRLRWLRASALLLGAATLYFVVPFVATNDDVAQASSTLSQPKNLAVTTKVEPAAEVNRAETPIAVLQPALSFERWNRQNNNKFWSYLQQHKLVSATELLNTITADKADYPNENFEAQKKAWLLEAKLQVKAAAERIATSASNLLEQMALDATEKAATGEFDGEQFSIAVHQLWRGANLDVVQLNVVEDHHDVLARLDSIVEKLSETARMQRAVVNSKLLDIVFRRTRPLLKLAKFDDAMQQFSVLPQQFIDANFKAQMYVGQLMSLSEVLEKYYSYLHKLVGEEVSLVMRNNSMLVGKLVVDSNNKFNVIYLGQTPVAADLLALDVELIMSKMNITDPFVRAQLLRCQGLTLRAISLILSASPAELSREEASFWADQWRIQLRDTESQNLNNEQVSNGSVDKSIASIVRELQILFPGAQFTNNGKSIVASFPGQSSSGELLFDFAEIDSRLTLDSWQLNILCQDADSVPPSLTLQNEIVFTKSTGALTASVAVGGNYLIGRGLTTSVAPQRIAWHEKDLYLNEQLVAPWQQRQQSISIDSGNSIIAITGLSMVLRVD